MSDSVLIQLRIPRGLLAQADYAAEREFLTRSSFIRLAIAQITRHYPLDLVPVAPEDRAQAAA
jgi:hypothetical protein